MAGRRPGAVRVHGGGEHRERARARARTWNDEGERDEEREPRCESERTALERRPDWDGLGTDRTSVAELRTDDEIGVSTTRGPRMRDMGMGPGLK